MRLKVSTGIQGIFTLKVINARTHKVRIKKRVCNLIVDSGLEALGTTSTIIQRCVVGTSSIAVSPSQTTLGNQIATTTTIQTATTNGAQATAPYFWWIRREFRFGQGVAAGNLTEIGIYTSSNVLFSRALITDSEGNPTTLTILSDEYLDVTYEMRVYPNVTDVTSTVVLMGETYNVVFRPSNITAFNAGANYSDSGLAGSATGGSSNLQFWSGVIGSITGAPSGSTYSHGMSTRNYISGSKELTYVFTAGLNNANWAQGVGSLQLITTKGQFQIGFTPNIPKDNFKTLVLDVTLQWDRYTP